MTNWGDRIFRNINVADEPKGMTVMQLKKACCFGREDLGSNNADFLLALDTLVREGCIVKLKNGKYASKNDGIDDDEVY